MFDGGIANHSHTYGNILLTDFDYSDNYINKAHPDDYKITKQPIQSMCLYHGRPRYNQLIHRISFKIANDEYFSVSFVCDTGCPQFMILTSQAKQLLKSRIFIDDDMQNEYIIINNRKVPIVDSQHPHYNSNVIGLPLLSRFGIQLNQNSFNYINCPEYF